jgi:hypothetical protein
MLRPCRAVIVIGRPHKLTVRCHLESTEQAFSAAVLGKRCVRIRTAQIPWGDDAASPHFSLYVELEGGDPVRAIFDLDKFFLGVGATALPQMPGRRPFRLEEPESLRPLYGRLIKRIEFQVDSTGSKKLHVHFDPNGSLMLWNEELASQLAVSSE